MVGSMQKFNRPKAPAYQNFQKRRRVMKQVRKKNKGVKVIPVADPELMTTHILKKRATNPRANITLSGKKKRKILKRLRRSETEKLNMEVESSSSNAKKKKKKGGKTKKKSTESQDNDVVMTEDA